MIEKLRIKEDGSPPNHLDFYYKINEIVEHLNLLDKLITDHADYHQREHLE